MAEPRRGGQEALLRACVGNGCFQGILRACRAFCCAFKVAEDDAMPCCFTCAAQLRQLAERNSACSFSARLVLLQWLHEEARHAGVVCFLLPAREACSSCCSATLRLLSSWCIARGWKTMLRQASPCTECCPSVSPGCNACFAALSFPDKSRCPSPDGCFWNGNPL